MSIPPPPPGFIVDGQAQTAASGTTPPPPPGFTTDQRPDPTTNQPGHDDLPVWAHLAAGEIKQQEAGHKLVQVTPGQYETLPVSPPRKLSQSEKVAITDAFRKQYEFLPTRVTPSEEAGQAGLRSTAQITDATIKGNTFLQNASAAYGQSLAHVGTGLLGTVAPGTANKLQENVNANLVAEPGSAGEFVGSTAGMMTLAAPSIVAPGLAASGYLAPEAAATVSHATALMMGGQAFGQVRQEVQQRREAGQQISTSDELKAAALSALNTFAASKVSQAAMAKLGGQFIPGVQKSLVDSLSAYIVNTGIQASDQMVMAVAQNAIREHFYAPEMAGHESAGVAEAGLSGGIIGAIGGIASIKTHSGPHTAETMTEAAKLAAPSPEVMKTLTTGEPAHEVTAPPAGYVVDNAPRGSGDGQAGVQAPSGEKSAGTAGLQDSTPGAKAEAPGGLEAGAVTPLPKSLESHTPTIRRNNGEKSAAIPLDFESARDKALYVNGYPRKGRLSADASGYLGEVKPGESESVQKRVNDLADKYVQFPEGDSIRVTAEKAPEAPKAEFMPGPQAAGVNNTERAKAAKEEAQRLIRGFKEAAPADRQQVKVRDAFKGLGQDVVFYDGEGRGVKLRGHDGTLFINRKNVAGDLNEAVSHEFFHHVQAAHPDLAQSIREAIDPATLAAAKSEYAAKYERMRPGEKLSDAELNREAEALVMGQAAKRGRVFRALTGEKASVWDRIKDVFSKFADKLRGKSKLVDTALDGFLQAREAVRAGRVAPREAEKAASFLPEPAPHIRDEAKEYAETHGITYNPDHAYATVNEARAKNIADWYEKAKHNPSDPQVKASYDAMKKETLDQWNYLERKGVKFEPWQKEGQPYKNSDEVIKDIRDNKHLAFYTGGEMPADHPLAEQAGIVKNGQELTYNDVFRAVHDYFGHGKEGVGFGPRGEENAWRSHSQMYSDTARPAMTAETRGQNSWVNFGPFAEHNRSKPTETKYAEQKATTAPPEFSKAQRDNGTEFLPSKKDEEQIAFMRERAKSAFQESKPQEPKTAFTNMGQDWKGATLFDWGGGLQLKKGQQLMGASGRQTRNFPQEWRQQFARVSKDATSLLEKVKGTTDEVLTVEGRNGGYVLAPKDAVAKAQAELQAQGIDPHAEVRNALQDRTAKREERGRQAESRVQRIDEEHDNAASLQTNPGNELPTQFYPGEQFVNEDVKPRLKSAAEAVGKAWEGVKAITAPYSRSKQGGVAKDILRERGAELQQRFDRMGEAFKESKKLMDGMSKTDTRQFIDDIENGRAQTNPALQPIADAVRGILDDRLSQVQGLGTGKLKDFVEDYFPHLWKDPTKAAGVYAEVMAKAPLQGGKKFLKQRSLKLMSDGFARGLEPVTENPIESMMLRVREMDKYITAHQAFQEMNGKGLLLKIKARDQVPAGYAKINDSIATIYAKPSRRGAIQTQGYFVAPEPVANVINNYLSPGIRGNKFFGPAFRGFLGAGNLLNSVQLGLSGFHLAFTTMDSMISKGALAIEQAAAGDWKNAGKSAAIASTVVGPVIENVIRGNKVMQEWYHPGTTTPDVAAIVDAMKAAGGRVKMDDFYRTDITKRMVEAFKHGNVVGAAVRLPFSLLELTGKPILEHLVPRVKLGAFMDMAMHEISQNPGMNHDEMRTAMGKAWDSVDNRLGEMVYDNLFWNKSFKDLAMASVRSVGWNLGTFRELGGGILDTGKAIGMLATRRKAELTHRMAYTVAMPILTGVVGGMIHYLLNGDKPKELKDYFFPKTGQKDKEGHDVRLTLPSYMKDVLAYGKDIKTAVTEKKPLAALQTISHKVHPMLNTILEMLNNKDYYGTKIYNEDDSLIKNLIDVAKHAGESAEPFGVREVVKLAKQGQGAKSLLPLLGVTTARKDITHSEAENKAAELKREHMPQGSRTQEEADKQIKIADIAERIRAHDASGRKDLASGIKSGDFTEADIESVKNHVRFHGLERDVRHLDFEDAMKVWNLSTPDERRHLGPVMFEKLRSSKALTREKRVESLRQLQADWKEVKAAAQE